LQIKCEPSWVEGKVGIAFCELVAAHLARLVFKAEMDDFFIIHHIDNSGDCFALVKANSQNIRCATVVPTIIKSVPQGDGCYFCWCGAHRNHSDIMTRLEKLNFLIRFFPTVKIIQTDEGVIPWDEHKSALAELESMGRVTKGKKSCGEQPAKKQKLSSTSSAE